MEKELELYLNHLKEVFALEVDISKVLLSISSVMYGIKKGKRTDVDNRIFNELLSATANEKMDIEDYADIDVKKVFEANTDKGIFGIRRVNYPDIEDDIVKAVKKEANAKANGRNDSFANTGIKVPSFVESTVSEIKKQFNKSLADEFLSKVEQCETMADLIPVCDSIKLKLLLTNLTKKVDQLSESLSDIEVKVDVIQGKVDLL